MPKIDFYASYSRFKEYHTVKISARNLREFEKNIWRPLKAEKNHRFLELGCGLGHILLCLKAKGVADFTGIDSDKNIAAHLPPEISKNFISGNVTALFKDRKKSAAYDRVIMLDLLEHLSAENGFALLKKMHPLVSVDGKILVRVPNAASPWGLQNQYGDITHITAYTPSSLKQVALAAGWRIQSVFPHREGSGFRKLTDSIFHTCVSALIARPPEIWSANFFAIFEKT
jgi:cyclopropane fatty-acyl-phospholipid synthase-like methyltransferase